MNAAGRLSKLTALVLALLSIGLALPASASGPVPQFIGHEATPNPITSRPIPWNPHMSKGSWSSVHNDTYMSDTYLIQGPLGKAPMKVTPRFLMTENDAGQPINGVGGITTIDSAGRLVVSVIRQNLDTGEAWAELTLMDPVTLDTLATLPLPSEVNPLGTRPAGIYLYQDDLDRIVIGTPNRTIWVVSHTATAFKKEREYDLNLKNGIGIPADDDIQALQPDFAGRLWFTSDNGTVGDLDMQTGQMLGSIYLPGERIVNGSAADEDGGVYVATTRTMYRFDADPATGTPVITWAEAYDAGTHVKAGQVDIGTGTTPTVMGADYVTISDNAEPQMNVLVYRRARNIQGPRLHCAVPVFKPGPSSNENSLVVTDSSIIVENNYGYKDPKSTENGHTSKPGISRIDVDASGCHIKWTNTEVSIPTLVTKLSLGSGLIYTYSKPNGPANLDPWYFTAIDFVTGETVYRQLAGVGVAFNNSYAAVTIGPDGTAYVGLLGGVVAIRDRQ